MSTLAGVAVSRAVVYVPAWGSWWADVDTVDDAALSAGDAAPLVLPGVTYSGRVASGGVREGRGHYRIAGGLGWGTEVDRQGYADDSGVRVSVVAADVARLADETLADVPSVRRGPHYARPAGPASAVLHELAPRSWYVAEDGVTHLQPRPATTYDGDAVRVRVDGAAGRTDLEVTTLAGLVPGVSVDGSPAATDVEITVDGPRLSVSVHHGAATSRRIEALRRIVEALDPRRRHLATYDFRVVTQSGERLNLQPVRASSGLPDLARVPVRLAPGIRAMHLLGSIVGVQFADGDPSRPFVAHGPAAGDPGWMPITLELGEAPTLGVARMTDPVIAGPFAGTITVGSLRVKAGS